MNHNYLKISAICVTLNRPQLTEAIKDFWSQTHKSSELIIVRQNKFGPFSTEILDMLVKDERISVVIGDDSATLGELRNLALQHCTGDYLMQWDDDDRYTHLRMERQLAHHLEMPDPENKASFIDNFLLYHIKNETLHWINRGGWGKPGSILFGKECPVSYPQLSKGEDQEAMEYLRRKKLCKTVFPGIVYLRRFHDGNTWDQSHFEGLVKGSFSEPMICSYYPEICKVAKHLGVPEGTTLCDANGEVGAT